MLLYLVILLSVPCKLCHGKNMSHQLYKNLKFNGGISTKLGKNMADLHPLKL